MIRILALEKEMKELFWEFSAYKSNKPRVLFTITVFTCMTIVFTALNAVFPNFSNNDHFSSFASIVEWVVYLGLTVIFAFISLRLGKTLVYRYFGKP